MKTTFEAWRDGLTPEAFFNKHQSRGCVWCPAHWRCTAGSDGHGSPACIKSFREWANAPAEEPMPKCPRCGDSASFTCGTTDEPDAFGMCDKCGIKFSIYGGDK
jgi:hypothetical protein